MISKKPNIQKATHCDTVSGYKMAAQNESSLQSTIHVRKTKACSRFKEYKFGCTKSAT